MPQITTLAGCVKPHHKQVELFRTYDLIVDEAQPFEVIGIGEESLVSYIKDRLFRPSLSLQEAASLAVYIIQAGKEYCPQWCGGPTDIEILKPEYPLRIVLTQRKIEELEEAFNAGGKLHLRSLLGEVAGILGSFK